MASVVAMPSTHQRALREAAFAGSRQKTLVLGLFHFTILALLFASGYPRARVFAVALISTWSLFQHEMSRHCSRTRQLNPTLFPMQVMTLFTMTLTFALTGGLTSPMLVSYLTPVLGTLIIFGNGREARISTGSVFLGTVALALLPASWRGPVVSQPWGMTISASTIIFSLVMTKLTLHTLVEAYRRSEGFLHSTRQEVAEASLRRARSLEQVGAKVAHELKNPLAAIKGLVQLTARGAAVQQDEQARERLAVVESEVTRMESILREYLSFSRPLQDLEPQPVELGKLAEEVIAVLEARAQGAGVSTRASGNATVRGDPRRLKEAMLNLVANALEATPPGGEVEVRVGAADDGNGARISVRDTGRGMAREVLERVGQPFFTTREAGTGLGVTLARAAFVQHGGELRYESEVGKGTTAIATVPSCCPNALALATAFSASVQ